MSILANCVFVIDKSIPLKKKVELIKLIKAQGGASVYSVTPKATHLVTSPDTDNFAKIDTAKDLGIHIISKEFIIDSIQQGTRLDEKQYHFNKENVKASPPVTRPPPGFKPNQLANSGNNRQNTKNTRNGPHSANQSTNGTSPPSGVKKSGGHSPPPNVSGDQTDEAQNAAVINNEHVYNEEEVGDPATNNHATDRYAPHSRKARQWDDKHVNKQSNGASFEDSRPPRSNQGHHHVNDRSRGVRESEDGCKIFVGGIMFDDLDALRKTKDGYSNNPDIIAHIQQLKHDRLMEVISIFHRYGNITRVKQFLDDRHIFLSFDNEMSAINAVNDLKPVDVRKKVIQDIRDRLKSEGRQLLIAPRVSFYVRWPKGGNQSESETYNSGSERYNSGSERYNSGSERYNSYYSGRSDSERSWRKNSEFSDNEPDYTSSAFSASESESDQFSPRYVHPNHRTRFQTTHYESDGSDSGPSGPNRQQYDNLRARRIGLVHPNPISTSIHQHQTGLLPQSSMVSTGGANTVVAHPPPAEPAVKERDWLWLWSKVIILLQVLAIMAIVYFYNRGGF